MCDTSDKIIDNLLDFMVTLPVLNEIGNILRNHASTKQKSYSETQRSILEITH